MSVALRAGCQRAHKVLMKMGETVVRNGDGLDTGHWTGAVGCVVILAQKHCILLKRTFAQPCQSVINYQDLRIYCRRVKKS